MRLTFLDTHELLNCGLCGSAFADVNLLLRHKKHAHTEDQSTALNPRQSLTLNLPNPRESVSDNDLIHIDRLDSSTSRGATSSTLTTQPYSGEGSADQNAADGVNVLGINGGFDNDISESDLDTAEDGLVSIKQEFNKRVEQAPHSRDVMRAYVDMQTHAVETVIAQKCTELKRSLKRQHAHQKGKLTSELEQASIALQTERDLRKAREKELAETKGGLEARNLVLNKLKEELRLAQVQLQANTENHQDHNTEIDGTRKELEQRMSRDRETAERIRNMEAELCALRANLQSSDARHAKDLKLAREVGESEGRNKAIEDLDASTKEERIALRYQYLAQLEKARNDAYQSGLHAAKKGSTDNETFAVSEHTSGEIAESS